MPDHGKQRKRRRKERGARGTSASARRLERLITYEALNLVSVNWCHEGLLCQGEICTTVTAGRGPWGDWSAQVRACQIRRGRDERQDTWVTSCTCDGGRLWATLAGIRGARHVRVEAWS